MSEKKITDSVNMTASEQAKERTIKELREFERKKSEADISLRKKLESFCLDLPDDERAMLESLLGAHSRISVEKNDDSTDVSVFLKPQQVHFGEELSVFLKPQQAHSNQDVSIFLKPQQAHSGTQVTIKLNPQSEKDEVYLKPQQAHTVSVEEEVFLKPQQAHAVSVEEEVFLKPQQAHAVSVEEEVFLKPQQVHSTENKKD